MGKVSALAVILLFVSKLASGQEILPLYMDTVPGRIGAGAKGNDPELIAFMPAPEKSTGAAILIFPGGAYAFLAFKEEGLQVAKAFADRGITAFVVRYRLPNSEPMSDKSLGPLMDAQQAIKIVRDKAASWKIDPERIGAIGYSAGGHLVSSLGTHFNRYFIPNAEKTNLRPDFMILVYPVISMESGLTHIGSRMNLLGSTASEERIKLFSNELQVEQDTPPAYITHAGDDDVVRVENSIAFYQALQKKGVDAELHLFPKGNHGFTQRLPIQEWLDPMLAFLKREGMLK